ncbi:MAG: hypothetical protein WC530_06280 [Candidatus Omnitrophota bacterium]|jgi:hypothetical protein
MTPFDLRKALFNNRNFFRFTGPPENWLTAIKFMTWGLEEKYLDRWKKIKSGDVFLMHSTIESLFGAKTKSSVVGLGVVGGKFRRKDDYLWIQEIRGKVNRWPLLVPFSEIYLFSEVPPAHTWEAPGTVDDSKIPQLIAALLLNAIPIKSFGEKFPVMGSWSGVRNELIDELFSKGQPSLYEEFYNNPYNDTEGEVSEFQKVQKAEETLRNIPTLKFLGGDKVKVRKIKDDKSSFERDNALLERAEESHADVLQAAIDFFQKFGFDTWSNQHVDLLAESEEQAFLVEVKSTLSRNFRTQARRAVGQLFEYEHFDIRSHFEKAQKDKKISKVLMVTNNPSDSEYTRFLNTLKIGLAWPKGTRISAAGDPGELTQLIHAN